MPHDMPTECNRPESEHWKYALAGNALMKVLQYFGRHSFGMIVLFTLLLMQLAFASQFSMRFYGNGVNAPDLDRVKIRIDDPANTNPGPPADIGATDFTFEFWMKASAADNTSAAVSCGANINWIYGNIIFDRDRFNQDRKFGVSIAGGQIVFGVSGDGTGDRTVCGTTYVLDDQWHHVALQRRRSDGMLWVFIDGILQDSADGPDGDVSYPDDGVPGDYCNGPCVNSDPFIVIGAEKHDAGSAYPSYSGLVDEFRLSTVLRYTGNFTPSATPFASDSPTAALYHFDEGTGDTILDNSGAEGGPSHGTRRFGGTPSGPIWSTDSPFASAPTDSDSDGIPDSIDNCPLRYNPIQEDADFDAEGDSCDLCTDSDGDGYGNPDYPANTCPLDNCVLLFNPDQLDRNQNGIGDACEFLCGDADGSNLVTISDAVHLINYIFAGGPAPSPLFAGDADCSGGVTISDAVYLINYIFAGGSAPCTACS